MKAGQEHRELDADADCVTEADRLPASARFRFRVRSRGSQRVLTRSTDPLVLLLFSFFSFFLLVLFTIVF